MTEEPLTDVRYDLVCRLLEEVGFRRVEIKIEDCGLTGLQQCMVYGNPKSIWGEIRFRVGIDLKKRMHIFRKKEYYMKFSFEHDGLESLLRNATKNVGCKKCFIMKILEETTPYLCVPIECYKLVPQIVNEYYRLDEEKRTKVRDRVRDKKQREIEEINKQLTGECK